MMDPIQETYGHVMTSLLFIPPLIADVFWFAAILASLGKERSHCFASELNLSLANMLSIIDIRDWPLYPINYLLIPAGIFRCDNGFNYGPFIFVAPIPTLASI